jgi:hypothetical protein
MRLSYAAPVVPRKKWLLNNLSRLRSRWLLLKAEFVDLAMDIGPIIIDDFLKPLMEILKSVAERFASLTDEQRQNLIRFLAIAAAIGPSF